MESKRHHFRPEHHLKRFADGEGKVRGYGVDGKQFHTTPKNLGVEGRLYASAESVDSPSHDLVEQWLARVVDDPAVLVFDQLCAGDVHLTPGDVEKLALFLVVQDMRTPFVRDQLMSYLEAQVEARTPEVIEQSIAAYELEHGPMPDESRESASQFAMTPNKNAWLRMMMKRAIPAAHMLLSYVDFFAAEARAPMEWITNDIGIVKFNRSFRTPIGYVSGVKETLFWMMPISAQHAIAMAPKGAAERVRLTDNVIRGINRQMVRDAKKHVYARVESPWIAKWLKR